MSKSPANIIPFDLEAEQAVIGSILLDKDCFEKVSDILNEDDFYDLRNGEVFRASSKIYEKGEPIDIVTVSSFLKRGDKLERVGGSEYLVECVNSVASSTHSEHYSKIVKERSLSRKVIETLNKTLVAAGGEGDVFEMADEASQSLLNLTITTKRKDRTLSDSIEESLSRIDDIASGRLKPGIPTGIKTLDDIVGGIRKTDVIIIAARPSVGKTSAAISIARNVAKNGETVAIFSLEMSIEQLNERILSIDSGVELFKLRNGKVGFSDMETLKASVSRLKEMNVVIDDSPSPTILDIRRSCRRLRARHKLGLVVIDYLQLIRPARSTGNANQDIAEISRGLKLIAKELDVPVVALSQLSRGVEGRDDKRVRLSDLRDSGAIEQDADIVIGINNSSSIEEQNSKTSNDREVYMTLSVIKHRNGPLGDAGVLFMKDTTEFKTCPR